LVRDTSGSVEALGSLEVTLHTKTPLYDIQNYRAPSIFSDKRVGESDSHIDNEEQHSTTLPLQDSNDKRNGKNNAPGRKRIPTKKQKVDLDFDSVEEEDKENKNNTNTGTSAKLKKTKITKASKSKTRTQIEVN
jgi:hypothetical protein